MGTFDNKVAIVTGGALGMGGAISAEFAREGASVAVVDINALVGIMNLRFKAMLSCADALNKKRRR